MYLYLTLDKRKPNAFFFQTLKKRLDNSLIVVMSVQIEVDRYTSKTSEYLLQKKRPYHAYLEKIKFSTENSDTINSKSKV
ncbi:hypothetical protein M6B38_393600 [Iris pallida]|uniref:Ribosomal protein L33 n=1 Tax=Iris pallida TaxID=29817 RepID=A0AAX6FXV7_IRIPA|nr:hypothetical protein M6B38_393600 [Iris pallida]